MKQLKWPRPPLILGCVLGDIVERYMFISIQRYGMSWLIPQKLSEARWIVLGLFALSFAGLLRPLMADVKAHGGVKGMLSGIR